MVSRGNHSNNRPSSPQGKGKLAFVGDTTFFEGGPNLRCARADKDIESRDNNREEGLALSVAVGGDGKEEEEMEVEETAEEKKLRMTTEYLARIADAVKWSEEEEDDDEDEDGHLDGVSGGRRVATLLKKKLLKICAETLG